MGWLHTFSCLYNTPYDQDFKLNVNIPSTYILSLFLI